MGKLTIYVQKANEPVLDSIPSKSLFFNNVLEQLGKQLAAQNEDNGGTDEKTTKQAQKKK